MNDILFGTCLRLFPPCLILSEWVPYPLYMEEEKMEDVKLCIFYVFLYPSYRKQINNMYVKIILNCHEHVLEG